MTRRLDSLGSPRPVPPRRGSPPAAARAGARDELLPDRFFRGDTMELGANRPFVLDGRQAFVVLRGDVHLFSVARVGGKPAGPRRHLARVGPGRLLLGLGPAAMKLDRALVAVPSSGTLLELGTHADLQGLLRLESTSARGFSLLQQWIEILSSGIEEGPIPEGCRDVEAPAALAVTEATSVRCRARAGTVVWVRPLEGRSCLFGHPELPLAGETFTPLPAGAWIDLPPGGRVELLPTEAVPDERSLWQGLADLAELVLGDTARQEAAAQVAETARAEERAAAASATMASACEELAGALEVKAGRLFAAEDLEGTAPTPQLAPGQASQLLAACRLVGSQAGVTIQAPPRVEGRAAQRDRLGQILRSSRIRARQVALRGQWWRQDCGPLLGFLADDEGHGTPVALLRGPGGYRMHLADVAGGRRGPGAELPRSASRPVNAWTAVSLSPFAYTFYRPFPERALSVLTILLFAMRGCGRDLAVVLALGLVGALLGMLPAMATERLFNDIIPGAQRSQMLQMSILLAAAAAGNAAFGIARGLAVLRITVRSGPSVLAAVWDRLLRLPLRFFRPFTAGELAVRAMAVSSIQQTLSSVTLDAIIGGAFSLLNLGLMFHYSPAMAARATLVIAASLLIYLAAGVLELRPKRALIRLQSRSSGLVLQLLTGVAKIRVAGAEARAFAKWAAMFARMRRLQFATQFIGNWVAAIFSAFPLLASVIIYWTVVPTLAAGDPLPRTGNFLAFLAAFGACLSGVMGLGASLLGSLMVLPLYEQAKPILESTPEVVKGRSTPGSLSGDIEVQHACFRYNADAPLVLRDVSFHIKPGELVAFVGASGSGKSTLMKLLLGFETLESGGIYYDRQELGSLDIQEVRRQMGVVLQNAQLMAGDIRTNIGGGATISLEQAWEAARLAGLADDIKSMPMGMHTVIGDGAGTLSGGQRQRLMIARAVVHRPKLILLDEATSALDNRNQAIVTASLERLQATRVVVAHRLSTIVNADRIYVLDRGRIAQVGTYAELMTDRQGIFAELARRQLT